jgi:hypothetical protein
VRTPGKSFYVRNVVGCINELIIVFETLILDVFSLRRSISRRDEQYLNEIGMELNSLIRVLIE